MVPLDYQEIANHLLGETERLLRKLQIAYNALNSISDLGHKAEDPMEWEDASMIVNNDTLIARQALKEMDEC